MEQKEMTEALNSFANMVNTFNISQRPFVTCVQDCLNAMRSSTLSKRITFDQHYEDISAAFDKMEKKVNEQMSLLKKAMTELKGG